MVQANVSTDASKKAVKQKDKYTKVSTLGRGASGTAHLVESAITGQRWVIKKVDMNDMTFKERVQARNEARLLECLNHPNITKFKDVFKDKKLHLNIVMEYADGGCLSDLISEHKKRNTRLSEDTILNTFTQVCLGLKHCHDRKILHRDVKPQNIFLTQRGICKVGDFGISKVLSGTVDKASTIIGTPLYLSPELLQSKDYNQASDIWALGILLYEMIALRTPWTESNLVQLGVSICSSKYPEEPLQGYSVELRNILAKLLKKNRDYRPTINQILRYPLIKSRIKQYLEEDMFREEFSHTLLHNHNVFEEF